MIRRNTIWAAVWATLAALWCGGRALGQQSPPPPDALIIVQPLGGNAAVTVSYASKVAHPTAKAALAKLGKLGKWAVSGVEVSDVDMKTSPQFGPQESLGVQTGVSGVLSGAPLTAKGGFILQPFVDAFRGLNSYKLLYWVAPQSDFLGLRSFDSPELSVQLVQEGGPYRYSIVNHTHDGTAPTLPLTQAKPAAVPAAVTQARPHTGGLWSSVGPVLAISAGSGVVVFLLLRIYARTQSVSRNRALGNRTTSRDSHRISRV